MSEKTFMKEWMNKSFGYFLRRKLNSREIVSKFLKYSKRIYSIQNKFLKDK